LRNGIAFELLMPFLYAQICAEKMSVFKGTEMLFVF